MSTCLEYKLSLRISINSVSLLPNNQRNVIALINNCKGKFQSLFCIRNKKVKFFQLCLSFIFILNKNLKYLLRLTISYNFKNVINY